MVSLHVNLKVLNYKKKVNRIHMSCLLSCCLSCMNTCYFPKKLSVNKISISYLVGSEGFGLREALRTHCHQLITIPAGRRLHPNIDSLNVSVATGKRSLLILFLKPFSKYIYNWDILLLIQCSSVSGNTYIGQNLPEETRQKLKTLQDF